MEITQKDLEDTTKVMSLMAKIDNLSLKEMEKISVEIFIRQPFFRSVMLGYKFDVTPKEHEELIKIFYLIWEFFKKNKNVQSKPITLEDFEKIQNQHIQMLKYAEAESVKSKTNIYSSDLVNLKSKALLTGVLIRYNTRPVLIKMDNESKGIILIGIKSFIKCFETL